MKQVMFGMLALAGLFVALTSFSYADKAADVKVGTAAPAFVLSDQDGNSVSLESLADKVVVLEWFNDQCPFVVKHYKNGDMNKLAARYIEQGVVWLAVDSSNFSNVAENKKIAGEWSINRPILDDASGKVGKQYGARTTPHMFVINKGTLAYAGAIDSVKSTDAEDIAGAENFVAKALDEILAGKPVSNSETAAYGCSVKYAK
jgi:peroxiredoxin